MDRYQGQKAVPPAPARRAASHLAAWVAATLVGLLIAGAAGVAAGPLLHRAAAAAIDATLGWLPSPSTAISSGGSEPLDVVPPPGAPAIPVARPAAPAPAGPIDAAAIGRRLAPATVLIEADLRHHASGSAGSGIVLTASGLVLTDEHVVSDADDITAQIGGTGRRYRAALIGVDLAEDVALLQLERASGLATATLGQWSDVVLGDRVAVIGYPRDAAPVSVGGRVIGLSDSVDVEADASQQGTTNETKVTYSGMLHTTARSLPGQSGGPVADGAGRVVGMEQAGGRGDDYDIPIDSALDAARQIAAGHASTDVLIGAPADLGLVARTLPQNPGTTGVRVVTVYSRSPAQSIGLRKGDVVTAIDGSPIQSAAELRQVLTQHRPGDEISLRWIDTAGHQHSVRVALAAGSAP